MAKFRHTTPYKRPRQRQSTILLWMPIVNPYLLRGMIGAYRAAQSIKRETGTGSQGSQSSRRKIKKHRTNGMALTRRLNYDGVSYRKETVSASLRFAWISGTGTNDGQYTSSHFVVAASPTNWTSIKELWGLYQIRGYKIKLFPPSTNLEVSSGPARETPTLLSKLDYVDNVDWLNMDQANQANAKQVQFMEPLEWYVDCRPEIALSTTGDVKIPVDHRKTWIPTESDGVKHRGIKFLLADMDVTTYGNTTLPVRAFVTYYYGLKQQE